MKTIGKIAFDFQMQNETFARELYVRWDSFFASNVERIADEVLSKHDNADHAFEIKEMNLDLGNFTEKSLDEYFPIVLKEKLEEALLRCLHDPQQAIHVQKKTQPVHIFELLTQFLLHGTLPWDVDAEHKDINRLFLYVLQESGKQLRQFLFTYGHYSSLQQRLVYQLNDPQLEKGAHLLSPDTGHFIVSYVHLLKAKYKETQRHNIGESDYRNSVWLVVYAYLLTNRSGYFDKKTFVAQTILQLANRYNLSYTQLLELLAKELKHYQSTLSIAPELFVILEQLKKELNEKQFKESSENAAKFYQLLSKLSQDNLAENISGDSREALIIILSKADSCRTFLQPMKEEAIYSLVAIVISNDSNFVVETAKSLDIQKGQGALQGKAGGEFRLLKWQIIFPLLLENRGAGFNRKYFVQNTLKKIAAHYNLEVIELLGYFCNDLVIQQWIDKDLRMIFTDLLREISDATPELANEDQSKDNLITQCIKQEITLRLFQKRQLLKLLADSRFRKKILNNTREVERHYLVKNLFESDAEFILSYAQSLDKLKHNEETFSTLKWNFIFAVLSEISEKSFNRQYFVRQVLSQISAHYNVSYGDLLLYFQSEEASMQIPFQLHALLKELFIEEKQHWIKIAIKNTREADKYKLLAVLSPLHQTFIRQYAKSLDTFHEQGYLKGKTSGNFKQIKWQFIFAVLFEMENIAFNKKQFLLRTLTQIANHYHLSLSEIVLYFSTEKALSFHSSFKEITSILKELQQKQIRNSPTTNKQIENNESKLINDIKSHLLKSTGQLTATEQNLLEKLFSQTKFISYSEKIIRLLPGLFKYFSMELKIKIDYEGLFKFLLELSTNYQTLSLANIYNRLVEWLFKPLASGQKQLLSSYLQQLSQTNYLVTTVSQKQTNRKENLELTSNTSFISNAGLVLLAPYYPRLFAMLKLTDDGKFISAETQIRAMFLLQYAAFGTTEFPEHEMTLNKILTDFQPGKPIPSSIELTKEEKDTVESMLKGALQHWEKLKNTSIEGLREGFLQREGKLEDKDDFYLLTVQEKTYDMLLDSLPWNFRTIKYPWIKKRIEIKWR